MSRLKSQSISYVEEFTFIHSFVRSFIHSHLISDARRMKILLKASFEILSGVSFPSTDVLIFVGCLFADATRRRLKAVSDNSNNKQKRLTEKIRANLLQLFDAENRLLRERRRISFPGRRKPAILGPASRR